MSTVCRQGWNLFAVLRCMAAWLHKHSHVVCVAAGQLVQSLGGGADGNNVFVALFCVTNAMGRLTFGFLPERSMHYFGTPRCASPTPPCVCMLCRSVDTLT
jgi:hypothetical protein